MRIHIAPWTVHKAYTEQVYCREEGPLTFWAPVLVSSGICGGPIAFCSPSSGLSPSLMGTQKRAFNLRAPGITLVAGATTVITQNRGSLQKKNNDDRWGDLDLGWGVEEGFQETAAEVEAGSIRQEAVGGKFQAEGTARTKRQEGGERVWKTSEADMYMGS